MTDKDVRVIASPEIVPGWPTPPVYEPLWSASQIHKEIESLIWFRGHEAVPVTNEEDIFALAVKIAAEYDKVYSAVLFENWQLRGLLKDGVSIDLQEDAK